VSATFAEKRDPELNRHGINASPTEKPFRRVTIWMHTSSVNSKHYQLYPVGAILIMDKMTLILVGMRLIVYVQSRFVLITSLKRR